MAQASLLPPQQLNGQTSPGDGGPRTQHSANSVGSTLRQKAADTRKSFKRPARWVLVFGWSLAVCAGFVNTVSFRSWGLYVSHVTGSSTAIGLRLEGMHQQGREFEPLREAVLLVFSFLVGAFLCGLLIDKNQVHFLGKAFYGSALVGNALLLVGATFVDERLTSACLAAAACGLQNAMCTSHFGAVVRTTHVTGTVTDIGSTLGRMTMICLRRHCRRSELNVVERAEIAVDARKLLVLLPMWLCYVLGCLTGAYVEYEIKRYAFLVPAGVTFVVGLGYLLFRGMLKDYFQRVETARLNQDMREVQDCLSHAKTRLQTNRANQDLAELDEELGRMISGLHEVEADVENLVERENSRSGSESDSDGR